MQPSTISSPADSAGTSAVTATDVNRTDLAQTPGHSRGHLHLIIDGQNVDLDGAPTLPEQFLAARREYPIELAVDLDQTHLVDTDIGEHEVVAQAITQALDQHVAMRALVDQLIHPVSFDADSPLRSETPVDARHQHGLESNDLRKYSPRSPSPMTIRLINMSFSFFVSSSS